MARARTTDPQTSHEAAASVQNEQTIRSQGEERAKERHAFLLRINQCKDFNNAAPCHPSCVTLQQIIDEILDGNKHSGCAGCDKYQMDTHACNLDDGYCLDCCRCDEHKA